jgi:hypothetical protein
MSAGKVQAVVADIFSRVGHFLIIFAYLWLLLSVYTLHNSVVFSDWPFFVHLGAATLKALIFAKFILIGEHLKLGWRVERLPLIWPILVKAALFAVILIGFDVLEELLVEAIWPDSVSTGGDVLELDDMREILSLTFMAFVALIPFFGIRELSRVIGGEKMRELFFGAAGK